MAERGMAYVGFCSVRQTYFVFVLLNKYETACLCHLDPTVPITAPDSPTQVTDAGWQLAGRYNKRAYA